jgi:hypothetical protein
MVAGHPLARKQNRMLGIVLIPAGTPGMVRIHS